MLDRFRRLLRRRLRESPRVDPRRRRPQLRAAEHGAIRRDPGVARRYVGRNSGRRLHADRELAVHEGGVRRVPRSPHRRWVLTITRWVFDGLRLVSLAQEACAARGLDAVEAPGDRSLRPRRHVPAEEDAVHRGRGRAAAASQQRPGLLDPLCAGPPATTRRRRAGRDAAHGHERGRLPPADPGARSPAVPRRLPAGHPRHHRRPPVLLSHDAAARPVPGGVRPQRCCSATA